MGEREIGKRWRGEREGDKEGVKVKRRKEGKKKRGRELKERER